jgi:uncharacterized membrane protein
MISKIENKIIIYHIFSKCKSILFLNKWIVISIILLLFCSFFVERIKNNTAFFTTFYQNDKLQSFELQLNDFNTDDSIQIIDSHTLKSNTENPVCDNYYYYHKIKSVLIDAEWSTGQTSLRITARKTDGTWDNGVNVSVTNNLSYPFDENKKDDIWYLIRRVTANNLRTAPIVIPCSYNDIEIFRIYFTSEPDVIVKVNKVIVNPKLDFLFNFKLIEFLSIYFLFVLVFFFLFVFPHKEKRKIFENHDISETSSKKPEKIFCIFAFIFGMIFVFLMPPLQSPDEQAHFAKSYSLSTLRLFPQKDKDNKIGLNVPIEYYSIFSAWWSNHYQLRGEQKYSYIDFLKHKNLKLSGNEAIGEEVTNSVFPVMYFPQAIGMFFIRFIENMFFLQDANILDVFYAGRIFNLLFYIIVGFFSIKTIPFYKNVIMIILLMPMSITQAASLSYDSCVIGISIFLICFLLKIHLRKEYSVSRIDMVVIIIMTLLIVNMKFIYGTILLMLLFIQEEKFYLFFNKIKYKKSIFICIVVLVAIISFIVWNKFIANIYWDPSSSLLVFNKESNQMNPPVKRLLSLIFDTNYYRILLYDLFENRSYYMEGIVGLLAWADTFFPRIFITISIFFILFLSIFDANYKIEIYSREKIFYFSIFIITVILTLTAMYLRHNIFPDGRIIGVQGRYFIPVLPLFFILFYTRLPLLHKLSKTINPSLSKITATFICFSLMLTMLLLIFRFYI